MVMRFFMFLIWVTTCPTAPFGNMRGTTTYAGGGWGVNFGDGSADGSLRDGDSYLRLVR